MYIGDSQSLTDVQFEDDLRIHLPNCTIISPELPANAYDAVSEMRRIIDTEKIDIIIGNCLGGMLAQKLKGYPKILINPLFSHLNGVRNRLEKITYRRSQEDGSIVYEVTGADIESYHNIVKGQFNGLTQREKDLTVGVCGNKADIAGILHEFQEFYEKTVYLDGDLDYEAVKYRILPTIAKIYRFECMRNR